VSLTQQQRYPRHPVSLFVGLGERQDQPGRSRNLSIGGLFLETGERPAVDTLVDLWFVWGEDTFVTKAKVIWHGDDGVGLSFVEPGTEVLGALAEILGMPQAS
jgi:hypothetical protein